MRDGIARLSTWLGRKAAPVVTGSPAPADIARHFAAPLTIGTVVGAGICIAIILLTRDPVVMALMGAVGVATLSRTAGILLRRSDSFAGKGARNWAVFGTVASWAEVMLVGALGLAVLLRSSDPSAHMLALILGIGCAGVATCRNGGRFLLMAARSLLVLGPLALGLWLEGMPGYRALSITVILMVLAFAELGAASRQMIRDALLGEREKAQMAAKYERIARYDSLTGTENRMAMEMRLRAIFENSSKSQDAVAILWLDLDRFKEVNDSLGHMVGDQLLRAVSEKLVEALDGRGHVARFGGDEFVLVCPDADRDDARAIAADVMEHFDSSFDIGGHSLALTASIGIAVGPQDGRDIDELMQHADVALYQAKHEGRNRTVGFTWSMKERFNRTHEMENGLRRAIANGELAMQYQPIFDLATGEVTACEALMRWTHPTLGRIPPSEFIPLAEASGMIEAMSRWALRESCSVAARWPGDVRVAVNISPASLASGELPREIIAILLETGLPARRLELEVTESIFLADSHHISQMLRELQLIGLKLVLDDFGTGYSSLSYLRSYRFDMIKVDQSFLAGIGKSREDKAIIQAVEHIAHALDMETVAEGIETEEQLHLAREAGFSVGQGFLLCPPLPADQIGAMMAKGMTMPHSLMSPRTPRQRRA